MAARPTAAWSRSTRARTTRQVTVKCDALLVDTISRSDTYPYVDVREDDVSMGHEATVSKVSDDQLFYLMSRGMTEDEAMAMIVRGFVEPIARELPMEYALELNRLIELQMEGARSADVGSRPRRKENRPNVAGAGTAWRPVESHLHPGCVLSTSPTTLCPRAARRSGGSRPLKRLRGSRCRSTPGDAGKVLVGRGRRPGVTVDVRSSRRQGLVGPPAPVDAHGAGAGAARRCFARHHGAAVARRRRRADRVVAGARRGPAPAAYGHLSSTSASTPRPPSCSTTPAPPRWPTTSRSSSARRRRR